MNDQLQGQRLGTGNEPKPVSPPGLSSMQRDETPAPTIDKNMTEEEREKIRAERVAAAEARIKRQGGNPKPKKKDTSGQPLRGPNTQNTMTWTAG